jgi:WD40 repeat protein
MRSQGPYLLTAGYDSTIQLSPIFPGQSLGMRFHKITYANSQVNRLVTTDEPYFGAAANSVIALYEILATGQNKSSAFTGHGGNVTDLVLGKSACYSCGEDRSWQMWERGVARAHLKVTTAAVLNALAVAAPDVVVGNDRGSVELWDVRRTEQMIASLRLSSLPIRSVAISRDGMRLMAGCQDGFVHALQVRNSGFTALTCFRAHDDTVLRVVGSPDESMCVTTSADSTAKLWMLEDYSLRFVLKDVDQTKWIWDAAFTHDGEFLCTAGTDKFFRTWSCRTGKCVHKVGDIHAMGITAAAMFQIF